MSWTYTFERPADPKAALAALLTWSDARGSRRVLDSAIVRLRVYYAAVEQIAPDGTRQVWAAVFLVDFRRGADGLAFGYKDMTEHMGPCESDCPAAILDLLTPTDADHALAWRARCRAAIAARADRPRLRNGATIVFEEPIAFTDGSAHARLEVVIEPGRPRAVRFRPAGGDLYRIGNLHRHRYTVEGAVS